MTTQSRSPVQEAAKQPRAWYQAQATQAFQQGRLADAESQARAGLGHYPGDPMLNNLLGVVLKNIGRYDEALQVLERAEKADPRNLSPRQNRGNVLVAMRRGAEAVRVFRDLVRRQPGNAEHVRLLGVALALCGQHGEALSQARLAARMDARNEKAWIDQTVYLRELGRLDEALQALDAGLRATGAAPSVVTARASLLQSLGRRDEAVEMVSRIVQDQPATAWAHHYLGRLLEHFDRERANTHYREAVRLQPGNLAWAVDLADSLDRTRGAAEGANIGEAHAIALRCSAAPGDLRPHARVLCSILERSANYEAAARIGTFEDLGSYWAATRQVSALHHQLARVETARQRRLLVEHHRQWGRAVEATAAASPLPAAVPRVRGNGKLRVGIVSSDLRDHPVTYFALPLIEHYDRSSVELFCYSWNTQPADRVQQYIAGKVDAFCAEPGLAGRRAAERMRRDGLDVLFELGGSTYMNSLEAMAWRPAPVQASWLGYPHSAGLEAIDYLVVDRWNRPEDPQLLLERLLVLEHSWLAMGRLGFDERLAIEPATAQDRTGRITFGTMNNPYKYRPRVLATWARVVRQVEGSRFLFVRPEGAVEAFRDNIRAAFEREGVAGDRVDFVPVRGKHMPHYNQIDICLDAFPQTGGTTTCESLWMGVPVVTLVGEAFFERLSYSVLMNAGLGELCAFDLPSYVDKAVALAADLPRRRELREGMRARIRSMPLGNGPQFARDFGAAALRAVEQGGRA